LRGVLWEALLEELHPSQAGGVSARRTVEACDRLAYVCSRALAAALASGTGRTGEAPAEIVAGGARDHGAVPHAPPAPARPLVAGAVIVDEREPAAPGVAASAAAPSGGGQALSHPAHWHRGPGARPEIAIRDERVE